MSDAPPPTRIAAMLVAAIGLCLLAQLRMNIVDFMGRTLLPFPLTAVTLGLMVLVAVGLVIASMVARRRLVAAGGSSREVRALASVGISIAIVQVGEVVLQYLTFSSEGLSEQAVNGVLYGVLALSLLYLVTGLVALKRA